MRFVVYNDFRVGVLEGDMVCDVSRAIPKWESGDARAMNRLIAGWDSLRNAVTEEAKKANPVPLAQVQLKAPVPAPTHLLAAPSNYRAHSEEMRTGAAGVHVSDDKKAKRQTAEELGFFMKAVGSITGPQDPIELPLKSYPTRRFDHEGEIAFVVGKYAQGVSPENAMDYIFGYTMMIDATMRNSAERSEERVQRKSFASFSPMGPCVVTADEAGRWQDLNVKLFLNGEQRQDARATDMIVDIPNLLSRASHVMPLLPGDVYTTGSPAGVSPISVGDTVVVEGARIGQMTLTVKERAW
jgi:2-keto-4-pentenoate hydratase/2-oxohepta-3-ene-1,7-dioic acid hydratase in catechol pathway